MKDKIRNNQERNDSKELAIIDTGLDVIDYSSPACDSTRREFLQTLAVIGGGAASTLILGSNNASAADIPPTNSSVSTPKLNIIDYSKIPQRLHKYSATDRAKKIVKESITMDTLFSGVWPSQWSSPQAPEFHDEMERCKAAGFKVLACCPSADSLDASIKGVAQSLMFYLNKISEKPDKYKIVRTTNDIDTAIKENKLGLFFTHQGTALFAGDVDMVGLWRQLGYGYCLLAYNQRNAVGDGCFETANGGLTAYGKQLIDAYNRYGMIVDVSHTGERTSLDAIERSSKPVISSHSGALAIADYQRSLSDAVIKAIAKSGGVCSINMVGAFMDKTNPDIVTTDALFRHIDYMANLVGIDHVGFGSDFIPNVNLTASLIQTPAGAAVFPDGGYSAAMGAKGVPTPAPYQIVAALVDKMLEKGYSEQDCGKFLGGNMYRVMEKIWI
jgi:membrane dipeptidase